MLTEESIEIAPKLVLVHESKCCSMLTTRDLGQAGQLKFTLIHAPQHDLCVNIVLFPQTLRTWKIVETW